MDAPPKVRAQLSTKAGRSSTTPRTASDSWFVMVHGPKDYLLTKIKAVANWIDTIQLLCCYHEGDKKETPHIHFVIKLQNVLQAQSLQLRVKELFEVKGKQYAAKPWDGNLEGYGAGSYLFHENSDPICKKGVSDEQIALCRQANEITQKVLEANKQVAGTKLIEKALIYFQDTPWNGNDIPRLVFHYFMGEIADGKNYHPGFRLKGMVEEVVLRLCPAVNRDYYFDTLYDKMFMR